MYRNQWVVPTPETMPAFQKMDGYAYEVPERIERWEWSTDFGRWGAIVVFKDGQRGYTYPKPF